jgi:hypothetical protein
LLFISTSSDARLPGLFALSALEKLSKSRVAAAARACLTRRLISASIVE